MGGGTVGCETADYLAPLVNDLSPANRDVTVIEMTKTLAANEGGAGRAVLITRMLSKGVHVLTEAKVTEITEDAISYEKDGEIHTIAMPSAMATRLPAPSSQPLCTNRLQKAAAALCVGQPPPAFDGKAQIVRLGPRSSLTLAMMASSVALAKKCSWNGFHLAGQLSFLQFNFQFGFVLVEVVAHVGDGK
ncbi:MAG: hypothetical protein BHV61_06980 [Collinsella sp. 60_9]|nr:MAG: hypothetical protein BHV61_06980 [Collinsella sp. 60_9]